jgi:hypothetical protein
VQSEYLSVITGVMDLCNQNICHCHHRSHGLVQSEYLSVITGVMDSCNQNMSLSSQKSWTRAVRISCSHHRSHGLVQSEYLSLSSQESWTHAIRTSVSVITGALVLSNIIPVYTFTLSSPLSQQMCHSATHLCVFNHNNDTQ